MSRSATHVSLSVITGIIIVFLRQRIMALILRTCATTVCHTWQACCEATTVPLDASFSSGSALAAYDFHQLRWCWRSTCDHRRWHAVKHLSTKISDDNCWGNLLACCLLEYRLMVCSEHVKEQIFVRRRKRLHKWWFAFLLCVDRVSDGIRIGALWLAVQCGKERLTPSQQVFEHSRLHSNYRVQFWKVSFSEFAECGELSNLWRRAFQEAGDLCPREQPRCYWCATQFHPTSPSAPEPWYSVSVPAQLCNNTQLLCITFMWFHCSVHIRIYQYGHDHTHTMHKYACHSPIVTCKHMNLQGVPFQAMYTHVNAYRTQV